MDREMRIKIAAERMTYFRKKYRPQCGSDRDEETALICEFERDLDDLVQSVIYNTYIEAQAPFVREFDLMKKPILDAASMRINSQNIIPEESTR
jgi:hypothetical protein